MLRKLVLVLVLALPVMAANDFDPVPDNLHYWGRFENDWTDSALSNDLTDVADADFNSVDYHEGSYAANFDGTGDTAYIAQQDAGFPGMTSTAMTATAWFRPEALPGAGVAAVICGKYITSPASRSWSLRLYNEGGTYKVQLLKGYSDGASGDATASVSWSGSPSLDEWYKAAGSTDQDGNWYVIWSNGTTTVSDDGVYASATTLLTFTATSDKFTIGSQTAGASYAAYFNGQIDDVTVWSEELSPTTIGQVLDGTYGTATGPTAIQRWWGQRRH